MQSNLLKLNLKSFSKILLNPHLKELLKGSIIGMFVKVLAAASAFFMNIIIARKLGPEESGLFFLGFTIVTFLSSFARMGLDNTIVRFVAAFLHQNKIQALYRVLILSFKWTIIFSSFLAILLYILASPIAEILFSKPGLKDVLTSMSFALPFVSIYFLLAQSLQGLKKIAVSMVTLNVLVPLSMVVLTLIFNQNSATKSSHFYTFACLISCSFGYFFLKKNLPTISNDKSTILKSEIWTSCFPLWGVMVMNQAAMWSSQFVIGYWESAATVAYFATAQRTAMLASFVLVAVNAIAAPKFSALHTSGDFKSLQQVAIGSVRLMLLAALPILLFMLTFPELLMSLFGPEFVKGATALQILAIGQFMNVATGSVGFLLMMTGNERLLRINTCVGAVSGCSLSILLIPHWGLTGAAIATATAVASQNLLGVFQVRRILGFNTMIFWKRSSFNSSL